MIAETDLHTVLATLEAERPEVCVVDSVQTLHSAELSSAAGSVGQVREVAGEIMRVAKALRIAVLLVGHVTKDGALAGPRVLEHLVDCVLQFEGERERTYRTVRAIKNRFGSTDEAGVFEMRDHGLVEVLDASARFVGEATRAAGQRRAVRDGGLAAAPRRGPGAGHRRPSSSRPGAWSTALTATGVALVLAVLATPRRDRPRRRRTCSSTSWAASASTSPAPIWRWRWRWPAPPSGPPCAGHRATPLACFGELGLTGELRTVAHADRRLAEAAEVRARRGRSSPGGCRTVREALRVALGRSAGGGAGGLRRWRGGGWGPAPAA